MRPIYLDYNATTPIAPEVVDAMLPYLRQHFGNPSSAHPYGAAARDAVERSRQGLAAALNAPAEGIVFTSSGTESNNLAIEGVVRGSANGRRHVITSSVEHPGVLEVVRWLERQGVSVSILPVDEQGRVRPDDLERAIGPDTLLVSVMHANNEVGTVQPISSLAAIAHRHGALMHTDAAQSVGRIPVDVAALGVDLLTVVGHKVYAPKGVGALYVRPGVRIAPVLHGPGHEMGRRPGTEAVAQIAALAEAVRIATHHLDTEAPRQRALRDRLALGLRSEVGDARVRSNGDSDAGLPNTLSFSFRGVHADRLLASIASDVAASAGSACHAHDVQLSPVLRAMGVAPEWAMGTLRLSLGRYTTPEDIEDAIRVIASGVRRVDAGECARVLRSA